LKLFMKRDTILRIAFISSGGTVSQGGMGRMASYLTTEFRANHPDLEVIVLDSYGPGRAVLMPLYFLKCFLTLGLLCLVHKPDVVHLNLAAHGSTLRKLLLMRLAQLFGVATLLHIHASKFVPFCDSLRPGWRKLLVASLSRASCIVVIGDFWRRYLVETLGVPRKIVTVIHNAVPIPEKIIPRIAPAKCRIVALGMLGPRKGTPELLEALASASMRDLSWVALIAGNGSVDESRSRAHAIGLGERVEIPGWVDPATVPAILAEADIFVLPSHNEGLPVSILEAMGAALPVVSTPVGAIPELVVEGTGILVPAGSVPLLAQALANLVKNSELRVQMGNKGRARVEQHFRIDVIGRRFANIYRALAENCEIPASESECGK
jgi:glycosyltransferase involved in cell wall biosynthesis